MHRKAGVVWWLWRGRVYGFCDILKEGEAGEEGKEEGKGCSAALTGPARCSSRGSSSSTVELS